MISWEVYMDIVALHRQGHSERAIARKTGIHRNTVKKHIQEGQTPHYQKGKRQESILTPYYQVIDDFLEEDDYRATWIYKRVRQLGYSGGYDTVKLQDVWGRPLDYWFAMNHTYDNGNGCHEKPE